MTDELKCQWCGKPFGTRAELDRARDIEAKQNRADEDAAELAHLDNDYCWSDMRGDACSEHPADLKAEVLRLRAALQVQMAATTQWIEVNTLAAVAMTDYERESQRLRRQKARLREALSVIEYVDANGLQEYCPWCDTARDFGHTPECMRQAALAETAD